MGLLSSRTVRPKISIVLVLLIGGLLSTGCRLFSTDLGRITEHPFRYHGQEVTVQGEVASVRWIPETGTMGFCVVDGADSLLVPTQAPVPREGERVRIAGRIHRDFPVGTSDRIVLLVVPRTAGGSGDVDR
ncbi:MAG: hypothetical protein R3E12_16800 [Candidatus Eisenbacteria bacterium]